jgi:hypothetical protein
MCASCATLRTQVEALQHELAGAIEGYEIAESKRRKAEREEHRLKRELYGSTTPESKKVQAVFDYHDLKWHEVNPRATGLSYYMDGADASKVRQWIRRGKDFAWFKRVLDGAFASDFHRAKPGSYLTLVSVLGDEHKVRRHLERADEQKAAEIAEQIRAQPLWPPVDRVLLELRRLGIEPVKADGKVLDDRRVWLHEATCPLCQKTLRVGEMFENGHASV